MQDWGILFVVWLKSIILFFIDLIDGNLLISVYKYHRKVTQILAFPHIRLNLAICLYIFAL